MDYDMNRFPYILVKSDTKLNFLDRFVLAVKNYLKSSKL